MLSVSSISNLRGCWKILRRAFDEKKLLSARLRTGIGIGARRVTKRKGEFIRTDRFSDDVVHVPPPLWIVQGDDAPEGSIPDPVFSKQELRWRFMVSKDVLDAGGGRVFAIARAAILPPDCRKILVWQPDGFYSGRAGEILMSWTFSPEKPNQWEHFEVMTVDEWGKKFEIIR